MGYSPCLLSKNDHKYMFFASFKLIEIIKRCENDQKSIKSMGYSPLIENNIKGAKMTQNRSKPWAIMHGLWPKMHVFCTI
jgi:hypothetical protein